MGKTTLTSLGGVIVAIIASLCCIGPVVLALAGVGSIAAFSVFETYRPYLIGLAVALIGSAFYLTYRKRGVKCEDGSCKVEGANKSVKAGIWSVTILAGLAIGFPYLGLTPQASMNEAVDATAVVTLNVSGMDCKACAAGIEGSLSRIKGVRKARVDFQSGKATIEYDEKVVKPNVFVDRVNESGFTATIEKGRQYELLLN